MDISRRRKELGLSQEDLCAEIGLSRQALSAIERGTEQPKVGLALRIARALGISVEELFSRTQMTRTNDAEPAHARKLGAYGIFDDGARFRLLPNSVVDSFWQVPNGYRIGDEVSLNRLGAPGIFIDGCDPLLGMLSGHLSKLLNVSFYWWSVSNKTAQANLAESLTHIALVHLPIEQSGAFGKSDNAVVVALADWELCIATKPGNPLRIRSIDDLFDSGARIALRVVGAGVRDRFDRWAVERDAIVSNDTAFESHLDACNAVRYGNYDATIAMKPVALVVGLDTVPIALERSYLVVKERGLTNSTVSSALEAISTDKVKSLINLLPNYRATR